MDDVVARISEQFKVVHGQLRDEVRGASADELNWIPAPETNSIAVLVHHTLGSEAEVYRVVANVPTQRDRLAEFGHAVAADAALLQELDVADALVDELAPRITAADLAERRSRRDSEPESGLHWLVTNYGHAREHLAHIQLTRQLYRAAHGGP